MGQFRYKAYDAKGAIGSGEIAALTRESALEALSRRGQIPFELAEAQIAATLPWWQREVFTPGGLSSENLATFARELASLVKAEIPIDEALRIVAVQPMMPAKLRQITRNC